MEGGITMEHVLKADLERELILFVNMFDINSEITSDFFLRWGYEVRRISLKQIEDEELQSVDCKVIIFQFLKFSDQEFNAFNRIRTMFPATPLSVTALYNSPKHVKRLKSSGVANFLVQPYTPADMKRMISVLV